MKAKEQKEKETHSLIETKTLYEGQMVDLVVETHRFGNRNKIFEIVHHQQAAVVIPIDPEGRILLIEQWRRAVKEIIIELPAGVLELGEEPIDCAKRELREETGFSASKFTFLGGFYTAPGFCDEYLYLFLAENLHHLPLTPDEDEGIDLLPVTVKEAKHMIEQNQIRDAKTIAGILRYICAYGGGF